MAVKGIPTKWTKEKCLEEAKKYTCKQEFHKANAGAYASALRYGWLKDYTWFKTPASHDIECEYAIYVYEDIQNKCVYVGLSNNVHRRHRQHIIGKIKHGKRIYDSVHKYFQTVGKEIPEPIIKMTGLKATDAGYYEDWYRIKYAENGWKVLNKGKTGEGFSSIGYQGEKLTKEVCYNIAKKYSSIKEFSENDVTVYNKAVQKGWNKEYTWLKKIGYNWGVYNDYSICYKEAEKYKSSSAFRAGCAGAYRSAYKHGWLKDYTWFVNPNKKWTKETCYNEALKYRSRREFALKCGGAYNVARQNGWLDSYYWFMTKLEALSVHGTKWTQETCYNEAKKYTSRGEFKEKNASAYAKARENNWLKDYTWFIAKYRKWDYESCKAEAKKYNSAGEFAKHCSSAYNYALKNGFARELFPPKQIIINFD